MRKTFRVKLLRLIGRSPLLTYAYTYLCGLAHSSHSLYCEQKAVLHGELLYREAETTGAGEGAIYHLRRNIHRLEKGLSVRDETRAVFAKDYIGSTVRQLAQLLEQGGGGSMESMPDETICWALDVLALYFRTVQHTGPIADAHAVFQGILERLQHTPGDRVPSRRNTSPAPPVRYEDLKELARHRRSTRWYTGQRVPRDLLDQAVQVALNSPSACNRQAFGFRIYDDPDLVQSICDLATGVDTFAANIPCLVVLTGQYRGYASERDRHIIYLDSALAAMAFVFALETLGLASCCLNWPAIHGRQVAIARLLDLAEDERVTMLISVGYSDTQALVPYSQKRSLDEMRSYNKT